MKHIDVEDLLFDKDSPLTGVPGPRDMMVRPRQAIENLTGYQPRWAGMLFGIFCYFSWSIYIMIDGVLSGDPISGMVSFIVRSLPMAIIIFAAATLLSYLLARFFGGKGQLLELMSLLGWSSLPHLTSTLTFILLSFVANYRVLEFIYVAIPLYVLVVMQFVWFAFLVVLSLSQAMLLSRYRAFSVFCIAFIPVFTLWVYMYSALI